MDIDLFYFSPVKDGNWIWKTALQGVWLLLLLLLLFWPRDGGYEAKVRDTQDAANGGEMGTGSDTGTFFIGGMRQSG